jgi:hypothetical protein
MFTCCTLGVNSQKDAWCNLRQSEWSCQVRTGGTVCRSGPSLTPSVLRGLCSFGLLCGGYRAGRPLMKRVALALACFLCICCYRARPPPF